MCKQQCVTSTNYFIQADEAVRMMHAWKEENADLLDAWRARGMIIEED